MQTSAINEALTSSNTRLAFSVGNSAATLCETPRPAGTIAATHLCIAAAIMLDASANAFRYAQSLEAPGAQRAAFLEGLPVADQQTALADAISILSKLAETCLECVDKILDGTAVGGDAYAAIEMMTATMDMGVMQSHCRQGKQYSPECAQSAFIVFNLAAIGNELVSLVGSTAGDISRTTVRWSGTVQKLTELLSSSFGADVLPSKQEMVLILTFLGPVLKAMQKECKNRIGIILRETY